MEALERREYCRWKNSCDALYMSSLLISVSPSSVVVVLDVRHADDVIDVRIKVMVVIMAIKIGLIRALINKNRR